MSLHLNQDTNDEVRIKSFFGAEMRINNLDIGANDMCSLVEYYLTNTNLTTDDPRLNLVKRIKGSKIIDGWGNIGHRISLRE